MFAKEFFDEEEQNVFDRLRAVLSIPRNESDLINEGSIQKIENDVDRVIKMFYLQMRVKGLIKEFKEDYFV